LSRTQTIRIFRVSRQLHPLKDGTGNTIGYYADDNAFEFSHRIEPEQRDELLKNGELSRLYEIREDGDASFIGYTKESAYGQSPNNSPASITAAEMLANVGLSRFRDQEVSRGRVASVQVKIRAFGDKPPWGQGVGWRTDIGPEAREARTLCE